MRQFLFHRFNNFQQSFSLSKFKHSQVLEDDYALKALQNKNWAYFIKSLVEVSTNQVDISSLSKPNELSILSQTTENLHICKEFRNSIYHNIAGCFQKYLIRLPNLFVEKMEDDINTNLFSNIDLKNEQDPAEIFKTFDTFLISSVDFLLLKNLLLFLEDPIYPIICKNPRYSLIVWVIWIF